MIESLTIPSNVQHIGASAFEGCYKLKTIYCKPSTPPTGGATIFANMYQNETSILASCPIYVPTASVDDYKSAQYWSDYADAIEGYDFE